MPPELLELQEKIKHKISNIDQEVNEIAEAKLKDKNRKSLKSQLRERLTKIINEKKEKIIQLQEQEIEVECEDIVKKMKEKCKKGEESVAVMGDPEIKNSIEAMDPTTSAFVN